MITAVDLDGDGQDEMFFYRDDGLFRYYNINPNGTIGAPILAGEGCTVGWDAITAVDLDGDGQDEMFFYRDDGLYRYYHIRENARLGLPLLAGSDYIPGWSAVSALISTIAPTKADCSQTGQQKRTQAATRRVDRIPYGNTYQGGCYRLCRGPDPLCFDTSLSKRVG